MFCTELNTRTSGLKNFTQILLLLFALFQLQFVIYSPAFAQGQPLAKYIILMIADGCGAKHIEATNKYLGSTPAYQSDPDWHQSWIATFPFGGSYDTNQAWIDFNYVKSSTTDSAAAATALYCGTKTQNGRISVSHDGSERLYSIGEKAKALGKAVGAVTTVPLSHATPGAWTSHNNSRGNGYAIADEAFFGNPNTTGLPSEAGYGGGHGSTLPSVDVLIGTSEAGYVNAAISDKLANESGQPGKHILVQAEAGQNGGTALSAAANDPNVTKLAGLFYQYYHTADGSGYDPVNPTLPESTAAALTVLNRTANGFVLMVEGGAVDWGSHSGNMDNMIGEMIDFYEAVQTVINWVDNPGNGSNWSNTLVIVTGDHETGYLTAGQGLFPNEPLGEVSDRTLALEMSVLIENTIYRASWDDGDSDGEIDPGETIHWLWNTGGHTNSLIPIYSKGVGSERLDSYATDIDLIYGNYLDNTDVFAVMNNGDPDSDGVVDDLDNCPATPNGQDGGTCTAGDVGTACMSNQDCGTGGFCSMNQEDTDGDSIGDACDMCPGGDDRIDTDNDGIPDDCDSQICGNSIPEAPEECDDGNIIDCDGCSSSCEIEASINLLRAPAVLPGDTTISQDQNNPTLLTVGSGDLIVWKNDPSPLLVFFSSREVGAAWGSDILLNPPFFRWESWAWYPITNFTAGATYEIRIRLQNGLCGFEATYANSFVHPVSTDLEIEPVLILPNQTIGDALSTDELNPTLVSGDEAIVWKQDKFISGVYFNYRESGGAWGTDILLNPPFFRFGAWAWYAVDSLIPNTNYEIRISLQDGLGGPEGIHAGYFVRRIP